MEPVRDEQVGNLFHPQTQLHDCRVRLHGGSHRLNCYVLVLGQLEDAEGDSRRGGKGSTCLNLVVDGPCSLVAFERLSRSSGHYVPWRGRWSDHAMRGVPSGLRCRHSVLGCPVFPGLPPAPAPHELIVPLGQYAELGVPARATTDPASDSITEGALDPPRAASRIAFCLLSGRAA